VKTFNVDIAAYLHLSGLTPVKVRKVGQHREFIYADTPMVTEALRAFDNNGVVPVKAFCEARALVKSYNEHDRTVGNFRRAVRDATEQL